MARILIIDDSGFTRRQVRRVLTGLGHEVTEASSGKEGLELLDSVAPEVVVTDLLMPEMDGFGFIAALRERKDRHSDLPILVLSADVQEASRSRVDELGAQRFLNKPVKPDAMREALAEVLGEGAQCGS